MKKLVLAILLGVIVTGCITTKSASGDDSKSDWVMATTNSINPQLYYIETYTPHNGWVTCFITSSNTISVSCVR